MELLYKEIGLFLIIAVAWFFIVIFTVAGRETLKDLALEWIFSTVIAFILLNAIYWGVALLSY